VVLGKWDLPFCYPIWLPDGILPLKSLNQHDLHITVSHFILDHAYHEFYLVELQCRIQGKVRSLIGTFVNLKSLISLLIMHLAVLHLNQKKFQRQILHNPTEWHSKNIFCEQWLVLIHHILV